MLRPARFADVFGIVAILTAQQERSRYAGHVEVDQVYARKLIAQAIQRNGGTTDGGSLANVVERDGIIESFCIGVLSRVYLIGNKLCAQDMFLASLPDAKSSNTMALLKKYVEWALANPLVFEINLSHNDALPEGARIGRIYERLGFARNGELYRMEILR